MGFLQRTPASILDQPLLKLTPLDTFNVGHLVENISIIGQPGSGKTTGSGAHLAKAILLSGGSLLVMCAKPDERALWERYCAETGRSGSLVIFDGKQHRYNFIAAEIARLGIDSIGVVIELIMYIMEAARSLSATARQGTEPFWDDMVRMVLRHSLIVIYLATGTISIASIIAFVRSAPRSTDEMKDPAWQTRSFFFRCFLDAEGAMDPATGLQLASFWHDEWAGLDNKTRSNAAISLCATLDHFNHGWLRDAFCTDTTMMPELLFHGAVIVLDMPALTHMEHGILGQRVLKYITQRVCLARQSYGPSHASRPIVIWMDEAPVFVDAHDAKFMSLCRSTLCGQVMMAQSISAYYAAMGGENSRDRVDMLLGNCATKIWHSTSCPITAKIAADTLGQTLHRRANFSSGTGSSHNHGMNLGEGSNSGTGATRAIARGRAAARRAVAARGATAARTATTIAVACRTAVPAAAMSAAAGRSNLGTSWSQPSSGG